MNANLRSPLQRRLAGVERSSRVSQETLKSSYNRMCAAEDAPRSPRRVFERRHGLAEIIERGTVVLVERLRVHKPQPERERIILIEDASRDGGPSARPGDAR